MRRNGGQDGKRPLRHIHIKGKCIILISVEYPGKLSLVGVFLQYLFWSGKGMNDTCSLKLWKINLITVEDELILDRKAEIRNQAFSLT